MVKFQDSSEEGYKHVRDRIREWSTNDELKLVHVRWGSYRRRKGNQNHRICCVYLGNTYSNFSSSI